MKSISYYLAHPFDSRKEMKKWGEEFERKTGIKIINPFYSEIRSDIVIADNEYDSISREEREEMVVTKYKEIVEKDLEKIKKSDGIIAFVNGMRSIGTFMEIVYASQIYHKPVYTIALKDNKHPWIKYHSTRIFTTLKDFEDWANQD
jgi:nucleoside 2-deoxyribosyltransferase